MKIYNELQLAKELIKFPSITPVDAGVINFLSKKMLLKYYLIEDRSSQIIRYCFF